LENIIERAVILSSGSVLNVPLAELRNSIAVFPRAKPGSVSLAQTERSAIVRALRESNGVIAKAALKLGMKRTTLNSKMHKLGISRSELFRR
jgi:formate hydrogenlyase transcriptional activator